MSAAIDKSIRKLEKANAGITAGMLDKAYRGYEAAAKYRMRFGQMKDARLHMEAKWRQVRDLLDPGSTRWLGGDDDSDESTINDSAIRDTAPRKMAQTAADGLHGGLSSSVMQWFTFYVGEYSNFDTEVSKESKIWLELAQECVRDVLANTNFYTALHSLYKEMLEFGCALMMIYSDADKIVRCFNYTIGSFWAAQNNKRIVDSVFLKSRQSARDIVDTYGSDRCPDVVLKAIENKLPDEKFTIIQCIQPWGFFGDVSSHPSFEYEDVRFIEEADKDEQVLYRGGYHTKPFIFARWSESWDYVYPRACPGIDALPDIRQLYEASKMYELGVSWTSSPAFFYDSALEHDIQDIKPGQLIPVTSSSARDPIQPVIPPVFDIGRNIEFRNALTEKISAIFYNREIMMITSRAEQNHAMTATEVQLLQQERNAVLGPITNRTSGEVLTPVLDRTFEIITREWRILDTPPEELYDKEIKPYFTSDMAVTQRQVWIQRANEVLAWLVQAGSIDQSVTDSFDFDQWAREFERTDAIPSFIVRSKDEVEGIRQQRAEAMQQQQRMEQADSASKVAQRLAKSPSGGDTLMAELEEASGGAETGVEPGFTG